MAWAENIESQTFIMPKKNEAPASFETALSELEQIVTRLESGDLPLEEALNEWTSRNNYTLALSRPTRH